MVRDKPNTKWRLPRGEAGMSSSRMRSVSLYPINLPSNYNYISGSFRHFVEIFLGCIP